eukprot:4264558-Amphidinium_carterae.2
MHLVQSARTFANSEPSLNHSEWQRRTQKGLFCRRRSKGHGKGKERDGGCGKQGKPKKHDQGYPLGAAGVCGLAAVLKAAGSRSSATYLYREKQMHVGAGHPWDSNLDNIIWLCASEAQCGERDWDN